MSIFSRCLMILRGLLGYGYLSTAAVAAPVVGACIHIPEAAEAGPGIVTACETLSSYNFDVAGTHYDYPKEAFREQVRKTLGDWALKSHVILPDEAWIEFWLAVPEGSPQGTMGRAVVNWKGGGLVAYLELGLDHWELASRNVGILDPGESYPTNFGHQAETLLVKPRDQVDQGDLHRYLQTLGASAPAALGQGWEVYHVAAMEEADTARAIRAAPEFARHLSHVELNAMIEWIAVRQRVFAFSFARP